MERICREGTVMCPHRVPGVASPTVAASSPGSVAADVLTLFSSLRTFSLNKNRKSRIF